MVYNINKFLSGKQDILYNFGGKIIAMIFHFSLDIASARLLGYSMYDEWNYLYSMIIICNWIIRFGIDSSCRVHIAKAINDKEKQVKYFEMGIKLQMAVSIIFVIVFSVLGTWGAGYLGYPQKYPNLKGMMCLGIVYSSVFSVLSCIKEGLIGFISFKKLFFVNSIEYMGYFIFGILGICLAKNYGLVSGYIFGGILAILISIKWIPIHFKYRKCGENTKLSVEIMKYASSLFLSNIGALVVTEMDTFMLGTMCRGEVGIYAIAKNIVTKATYVPQAVCVATMVQFAVIKKIEVNKQKKQFWRIIGTNFLIIMGISLFMLIFAPVIIPLLYGQQYKQSVQVFIILIPYFFLYGITIFFGTFVIYQKKSNELTFATVLMIIFNLGLNYIFIPKWGAKGAAFASSLSVLPYALILLYATVSFWKHMSKDSAENY